LKYTLAFLNAALLASALPVWGDPTSPIDPTRLSATVKTLASDAFQGRAPGTPGETTTVAYLVDRFRALGLQPGGENGGWLQQVPLVHNVAGEPTRLEVRIGESTLPLVVGRDINPQTSRSVSRVTITDAPIVFVGYGVTAPERNWDDFKGVDLHGKVALFLVNDPDFEASPGEPVTGKFGGRAMTYYGRWTYKFAEAARRGAIAAFVIHETAAAGYGWNVASNSVGGTYDIVRPAGQPQAVLLQAWISRESTVALLSKVGLNFEALKRQARNQNFKPVELSGARFSIDMPVKTERVESRNVLAKLPGAKHRDESILFAAHWDAYGIGAPDSEGRTIRPGANDDGLGIAGVLELARAFAKAPRTERTLVFAAWTAEERGLLGSETFGAHPLYPPAKIVANLTIDVLQTAGPSRDVVLVGAGQNDLEKDLAQAAAAQGRTVTPDAKPERGLFYRADHFSLAKRGVPTLLLMGIGGGADLVTGGRTAGDAWVSDYTAHCYHQTCDSWSPDWDLRGAVEDIDLFYRMGLELGNSRRWPEWNAGSEFKAIRDASASARHPIHWVDTWAAPADSAGPALNAQTVRQVIRTSVGGSGLRLRLSNLYGSDAVTLGSVSVARHAKGSAIQSGTEHRVTFGGQSTVTVAKGADVLSDPVEFPAAPLEDLAISIYVPAAATTTLHGVGLQTAYLAKGDLTGAASLPGAETDDSRYFLTDVETAAPADNRVVVVVGDSITDGVGSTEDGSARWPDALAARLQADHALASIGVINSGIAGNRVLRDGAAPYLGPSLLSRFDRDALSKPGVRWILLLEGINDISASDILTDPQEHVSAQQIIDGMKSLIQRAHARGIDVWGATLLPYKDTKVPPNAGFHGPYYTATGEAKRQAVNHWIRTAHAFDAVIDLDQTMRDPGQPDRLRSEFDSGDHLHPNDAGHKAMAAAIDRRLFLPVGGADQH